jgi:hypothetical protein
LDYYTQHRDGTVWYFGEATQTYDRNGHPKSTEGSWQAGVNGAKPGIFMRLHPRVGQSFRQEYYKGHAEDHFRVLSLHASVTVPYGTYRKRALLTEEWSPLDKAGTPRERKYYAHGVGKLREGDGELVSVTHR